MLDSMYGYEPPKSEREGSWGEIFALTKAVFIALAVPLGLIGVALGLILGALVALFTYPPYAVPPLAVLGLAWWYMIRRDRQAQAELDEEINGIRPMRDRRQDRRPPR